MSNGAVTAHPARNSGHRVNGQSWANELDRWRRSVGMLASCAGTRSDGASRDSFSDSQATPGTGRHLGRRAEAHRDHVLGRRPPRGRVPFERLIVHDAGGKKPSRLCCPTVEGHCVAVAVGSRLCATLRHLALRVDIAQMKTLRRSSSCYVGQRGRLCRASRLRRRRHLPMRLNLEARVCSMVCVERKYLTKLRKAAYSVLAHCSAEEAN